LLPESKPVVLDASKMTPEARDTLRGILERARSERWAR
jgi:hypothetical protein